MRIWQRAPPSHAAAPGPETTARSPTETSSETWKCTAVLEDSHRRTIRTMSWAPGSRQLATASFDGTSAIWRVQGAQWEQVGSGVLKEGGVEWGLSMIVGALE